MAKQSDAAKVAGNPELQQALADAVEEFLQNWCSLRVAEPLPTIRVVISVASSNDYENPEQEPDSGVSVVTLHSEDYR